MPRRSRENPKIRQFILQNISAHPHDIGPLTARYFNISRAASSGYLRRLTDEGIITAQGNTNRRYYWLNVLQQECFTVRLTKHTEEDVIWRYNLLPLMAETKPNIIGICEYGFTEMLNNAIDHSASTNAKIDFARTYNSIQLTVADSGVGIFDKIQKDFNLADPRSALLELSKGKLTSDPKNHAGEGIFFTSRMFDHFAIKSGHLHYRRARQDKEEWLVETEDLLNYQIGTTVTMEIQKDADWTTRDIFKAFESDRPRFRKTHVPISLGRYPGESLVSRSQAKRVLARFDKFSEVMLDFKGVKMVGQAFADEIFRVFKHNHPDIRIVTLNASSAVQSMIDHVQRGGEDV